MENGVSEYHSDRVLPVIVLGACSRSCAGRTTIRGLPRRPDWWMIDGWSRLDCGHLQMAVQGISRCATGALGSSGPMVSLFCFVLILVFITRYMQPVGLWQRQSRCPLEDSDGFLESIPISYLEPACAVIVRCPMPDGELFCL